MGSRQVFIALLFVSFCYTMESFIAKYGLDKDNAEALARCPSEVRDKVIAKYDPSQARNIQSHFNAFLNRSIHKSQGSHASVYQKSNKNQVKPDVDRSRSAKTRSHHRSSGYAIINTSLFS